MSEVKFINWFDEDGPSILSTGRPHILELCFRFFDYWTNKSYKSWIQRGQPEYF